jgi:hypothetical protein
VADVAEVLVEVAAGEPQQGIRELPAQNFRIWSTWLVGRSPHRGHRSG